MESEDTFDYFGSLNQAAIDAQKSADKDALGGNRFVSMKEKPLKRLRFYKRYDGLAFHPCKQHWIQNPENKSKLSITCRQLAKEQCPLCDLVAELETTGNPHDLELADDIKAGFDYLCNVEDQDEPGSVKIFRCKVTLYKALFGTDDKTRANSLVAKYGDFTDPQSGYLIDVTKYDAQPWYTANVVISPQTKMLALAPAKRELGPKLFDLSKETLVQPLGVVQQYADCIRNGTPFPKRGDNGGGNGRNALPNRSMPATSLAGTPANAQAARGPSVQSRVETPIDADLFGD